MRLIPRPTRSTVGVGDVVAFSSPFNQHDPHGVMVSLCALTVGDGCGLPGGGHQQTMLYSGVCFMHLCELLFLAAPQVRRIAALENHIMLSSEDDDAQERIPPGHCWVLADNEQLEPPDVIDSRAFGYLDMNLIQGRVIYRVRQAHTTGGGGAWVGNREGAHHREGGRAWVGGEQGRMWGAQKCWGRIVRQ